MKKRQLLKKMGFTLIEMLMVIAISSIITYAIFTTMRVSDQQIQTTQTRMTLQDSAREGLYRMSQEIRQTRGTSNFAFRPNGCSPIAGAGQACTQINFDVPDPNATPSALTNYAVDWAEAHQIQYVRGGLNNSQVIRTDLGTQAAPTNIQSVIANDVTSLTFSGNAISPNLVTINLSVQRTMKNGRLIPQIPIQTTIQAEVRNS